MTAPTLLTQPQHHGLVDGMPFPEYLAVDALSASSARKLLPPSCPALFKAQQEQDETSDEMDFGKIAHQLVLEGGVTDGFLDIVDEDNWRTKAAQETRKTARDEGRVALLAREFKVAKEMAEAILRVPMAAALLDAGTGRPELSMFWQGPHGAPRKGRLDILPAPRASGRLIVPDYKTAACAEKDEWARTAVNLGYHQQAAGYREGMRALDVDEDPQVLFIVQERRRPYLVNVIELDDEAMNIGRHLNQVACRTYVECLESGRWPGYPGETEPETVTFPRWYTARYDEAPAA